MPHLNRISSQTKLCFGLESSRNKVMVLHSCQRVYSKMTGKIKIIKNITFQLQLFFLGFIIRVIVLAFDNRCLKAFIINIKYLERDGYIL